MKRCRLCGEEKPLDEFTVRRWREGKATRRTECHSCHSAAGVTHARAIGFRQQAAWSLRNRSRLEAGRRAQNLVAYAIKEGVLIRPNVCEACGGTVFTEAAHSDYARPLDVRWLCRRCHRRWDRTDPKTLRPAGEPAAEVAA